LALADWSSSYSLKERAIEVGLQPSQTMVLLLTFGGEETLRWFWHDRQHLPGAGQAKQSPKENDLAKWFRDYCAKYSREVGKDDKNVTVVKDDQADIFVEWVWNICTVAIFYKPSELSSRCDQCFG
jgi:hypothetical protein